MAIEGSRLRAMVMNLDPREPGATAGIYQGDRRYCQWMKADCAAELNDFRCSAGLCGRGVIFIIRPAQPGTPRTLPSRYRTA